MSTTMKLGMHAGSVTGTTITQFSYHGNILARKFGFHGNKIKHFYKLAWHSLNTNCIPSCHMPLERGDFQQSSGVCGILVCSLSVKLWAKMCYLHPILAPW